MSEIITLKKAQFLAHWATLSSGEHQLNPNVVPIPYKHQGSTYGMTQVRIMGSAGFVDWCLFRLADLRSWENSDYRLATTYRQASDKEQQLIMLDTATGEEPAMSCYVQVHQRGKQAQLLNALQFGRVYAGEVIR